MNGGNCIFCIFCVFIGIWLIFVDIFTQSNTKLSLKGCQMRRKGVWSGPPDLRTFANLAEQVEKLPEDPGRRNKTAVTAGTQSVVGDVLVRTAWDADDKTVLS